MILNEYMDTVVPWENHSFNSYDGEIRDGKLLGVGSADIKASLSVLVYVVKTIIDHDFKLKGSLISTFGVDDKILCLFKIQYTISFWPRTEVRCRYCCLTEH